MSIHDLSLYPLKLGAGAVGAPSLYLSTDSTTGLYRPAANQIGITISGTQRALFTAAGLTLTAGTAAAPSLTYGDSTTGGYRPAANQLGWAVSGVERQKLDAADMSTTRSGGQATFTITSYAASSSLSSFRLYSSRGTSASPSTLLSGDAIALLSARAWTSGTTFTQCGLFRFAATENHTSTATGSQFLIQVCANTGTTLATGLIIDHDLTFTIPGSLKHTGSTFGVLNSTPVTKGEITGDLSTYNETAFKAVIAKLADFGFWTDSTTT
jgi:hypothetical protein